MKTDGETLEESNRPTPIELKKTRLSTQQFFFEDYKETRLIAYVQAIKDMYEEQ